MLVGILSEILGINTGSDLEYCGGRNCKLSCCEWKRMYKDKYY